MSTIDSPTWAYEMNKDAMPRYRNLRITGFRTSMTLSVGPVAGGKSALNQERVKWVAFELPPLPLSKHSGFRVDCPIELTLFIFLRVFVITNRTLGYIEGFGAKSGPVIVV